MGRQDPQRPRLYVHRQRGPPFGDAQPLVQALQAAAASTSPAEVLPRAGSFWPVCFCKLRRLYAMLAKGWPILSLLSRAACKRNAAAKTVAPLLLQPGNPAIEINTFQAILVTASVLASCTWPTCNM